MEVFLLIVQLVVLAAQVIVLHFLYKHEKVAADFAKDIPDYIDAYEHVKDIVNKNSSVFSEWYDILGGMKMELGIMSIRVNLHGEALGIKQFQMPELPKPQDENVL